MAKIIQLIFTEDMVGEGKKDSPFRKRPQLWTLSGKLVAQYDMWDKEQTILELSNLEVSR